MKKWIAKNWTIATPAAIVIAAMVGALIVVGVASANHDTKCGYTTAVNGDNYNVVIGITADEQGYYFEMDDHELNVTNLAPNRYRIHFTEAHARTWQTFYAQAYTPSSSGGYSFCEVHGGFYVKGG